MSHGSSRGDARRSLALLWGRPIAGSRGPKPGLDVATIVKKAIALADEGGLDGFSMRELAEALGCSAMALYTYVHGKAELVDLMLDAVLAGAPTLPAEPRGGTWRARLEASARASYQHLLTHPWLLQVNASRVALGPNELAEVERQLALFDGLGLSGSEMMSCMTALTSFVRGAARAVSDARQAARATGVSDDAWWAERSAALEEMAPDLKTRFPLIARLDEERAFDLEDGAHGGEPYTVQDAMLTFDFGLARVLDGLEAFVAAKPTSTRTKSTKPPKPKPAPKPKRPARGT